MNLVMLNGEKEEKVLDKELRGGRVNVPTQALKNVELHLFHFFQSEETPAELEDRVHGGLGSRDEKMFVFVEFDGHVEAGHGQQLEKVLVNGCIVRSEVAIEEVHGDAHNLAVEVKVIDNCACVALWGLEGRTRSSKEPMKMVITWVGG